MRKEDFLEIEFPGAKLNDLKIFLQSAVPPCCPLTLIQNPISDIKCNMQCCNNSKVVNSLLLLGSKTRVINLTFGALIRNAFLVKLTIYLLMLLF